MCTPDRGQVSRGLVFQWQLTHRPDGHRPQAPVGDSTCAAAGTLWTAARTDEALATPTSVEAAATQLRARTQNRLT